MCKTTPTQVTDAIPATATSCINDPSASGSHLTTVILTTVAPVPLYLTSMGLYGEVKSYNDQAACTGSDAAMLVQVDYGTQGKCLVEGGTRSFFLTCKADLKTNMNVLDYTDYATSSKCVTGPGDKKMTYMPVCTLDAKTDLVSISKCTLFSCTGVTAPTNGNLSFTNIKKYYILYIIFIYYLIN